jgi:asparagine synthase (glutamine-hydrolysing)
MCGIAGVVAIDETRMPGATALERMRDVLAHRGPDGAGAYRQLGVWLGHRRLSIVDVAHGHQPMVSADGRVALCYNGEVFNHPELMRELQSQGVTYQTHCDTETILHLVQRDGADAVHRLRGMFAFAAWDAETRRLLLVRDRFGVKPLYYASLPDGTLLFASEIKAILASGLIRPALHQAALPSLLSNLTPPEGETMFSGIRRLPPGHLLTWDAGTVSVTRYWDLPERGGGPGHAGHERDLVAEYRERLTLAVKLRLMADVPLGVFLSGGIDSAAVTTLMSQMVGPGLHSFSVAFREREANEFHWARLVARHAQTEHHEVLIDAHDFFGALPRMVWHEDEPIAHPSSIPLHFVSMLAAERVKVVLSGEGADESLGGYNRYRVTLYNKRWGTSYERLAPHAVRVAVRGALDALPRTSRTAHRLRRTFLSLGADLSRLYSDNFAVFPRAAVSELLTPETAAQAGVDPYADFAAALATRGEGTSLLSQLLYADIKTYLQELLMKQDQMSMSASLESRVPFLDHPLVEWTWGLPDTMKVRGTTTKWILREAMRDQLPAEILTRRKMGFPVPIAEWFRTSHAAMLRDVLLSPRTAARALFRPEVIRRAVQEHQEGVRGLEQRLWVLLNIELWHRVFIDGESPDEVTASLGVPSRRAA